MKVLFAAMFLSQAALAQAAGSPAPQAQASAQAASAGEEPGDVLARVHYERAVRAELDAQWTKALEEAQATIDAAPAGRFADSARKLQERVQRSSATAREPAAVPGAGVAQEPPAGQGPRVELVISSTITGLYLASLAAGALSADQKGTIGLLMIGTGAGLAGSLLGSAGRRVPQSMPALLELGALYGTSTGLLLQAVTDSSVKAGPVLAAVSVGALGGLLASPHLTSGDAAAALSMGLYGAVLPVLVEASVSREPGQKTVTWTALLGSTAGVLAGPIANRALHFSRGRWNLITLGGGVGALFGAGIAVLTDVTRASSSQGAFALTGLGTVAGLGLTTFFTSGFGADEPRGLALLHLEDGKPSVGNVLAAVGPAPIDGHLAMSLRLIDGAF